MNSLLETTRRKTTMVMALPTTSKKTESNESKPQVAESPTRSRLRKFGWAGVVLAVLGTGAFVRQHNASESAESGPHVSVRQVNVTTPQRASSSSTTLPATIQAYQATDLFARANGYLKAWHFDIGAPVKAGQVLAEIETPEVDQELAQAIALLKQGRAEHQQAIVELDEAKSDVALAEANVVKAKAHVDFSVGQAKRYQALFNVKSVAREEYDNVVRDRDARNAELASANAELTRRKSNLSTRAAIIESRAAVVGNRDANVRRLRDLTGFQKIVAPFDGIVTRRNAEVGMLVTAGSNTGTRPLFSVAQIDVLRVQAAVPQSSAVRIKAGDEARVTIPERPGHSFTAKVARTAGAVEPMSRSLLVEVELPNPNGLLLPGVYAQIRFESSNEHADMTIPAKTLLMQSNGPHVVIVAPDDTLRMQKVTLGRDFGTSVEVLVGLKGDERLVVNPSDDLRDGQVVRITDKNSQDQVAQK